MKGLAAIGTAMLAFVGAVVASESASGQSPSPVACATARAQGRPLPEGCPQSQAPQPKAGTRQVRPKASSPQVRQPQTRPARPRPAPVVPPPRVNPPVITPPPVQPVAEQLIIRVCNESGHDAFSAVLYRAAGVWHSVGWFRVNNGECRDIATSDNRRFYVFAEEVGNVDFYWAGSFAHCVRRPGPYDIVISSDASQCAPGDESKMFVEWLADEFGTFTWRLEPGP